VSVAFPAIVDALRQPSAYPHRPRAVQLVQTHTSVIFLADSLAFKVKKPVNLGFLDFTTIAKRLFACEQEVLLNRRLCPHMYLGVVPITKNADGIAVEGRGEVVDYAVKMHRLPDSRMMDRLLAQGKVNPRMIERIAIKVAAFHRTAATRPAISFYGQPDIIARNVEENFAQTEPYVGKTLPPRWLETIADYSREFLRKQEKLFWQRIAAGRIRDCHGDLRPEHICLIDGICIFDCVEFNARFRYADVAADLAFLVMELDFAKRSDLSELLVDRYLAESGDKDLRLLLPFYKCYRAYVRGKVESFKLDLPGFGAQERVDAREVATGYFALSLAYAHGQRLAAV